MLVLNCGVPEEVKWAITQGNRNITKRFSWSNDCFRLFNVHAVFTTLAKQKFHLSPKILLVLPETFRKHLGWQKAIDKNLETKIFEAAEKILVVICSQSIILNQPIIAAYTEPQERERNEVIVHTPERWTAKHVRKSQHVLKMVDIWKKAWKTWRMKKQLRQVFSATVLASSVVTYNLKKGPSDFCSTNCFSLCP